MYVHIRLSQYVRPSCDVKRFQFDLDGQCVSGSKEWGLGGGGSRHSDIVPNVESESALRLSQRPCASVNVGLTGSQ